MTVSVKTSVSWYFHLSKWARDCAREQAVRSSTVKSTCKPRVETRSGLKGGDTDKDRVHETAMQRDAGAWEEERMELGERGG